MDLLVTAIATVIVGTLSMIGSIYGSKKSAEKTEALLAYRMTQLETKVDKHNSVIDRTYKLEQGQMLLCEQIKVTNHRIDDLEREG